MANYLLLRSNKESGPYNLDDLVRGGLKPYDLIWVQGKSAAWRYPGEIEELKPYAPSVEEQPFDRFFKKNPQETKEKEDTVATQQAYQPAVTISTVAEEKYAGYIPKKSVFVTMPGQSAAATSIQKQVVAETKPVPEPTITVTENPSAAQIKYSQPLDEIKEMYVKTLQERKTKMARKSFVLSSLKKSAIITGLVFSGLLAGYLIKSVTGKRDTLAVQTIPATLPVAIPAPVESHEEPATQKPATEFIAVPDQPVFSHGAPAATTPVENTPMPPAMKEKLLQQEKKQYAEKNIPRESATTGATTTTIAPEQAPVRTIDNDPTNGERNRQVRTSAAGTAASLTSNAFDVKSASKPRRGSSLENLVAVTSNDYKRVAFGGIRNLELTVSNDSKYLLDKVTVELQYVKPNEMPLRTETLQFRNISPNGSSTIRVPDTNRGIKVLYKIVGIESAQSETALSAF